MVEDRRLTFLGGHSEKSEWEEEGCHGNRKRETQSQEWSNAAENKSSVGI